MITALGGGVGAAKFLEGLASVSGEEPLNIIVNTGDDITLHGLKISPDIDTVIYRLSGMIDKKKGWGIEGDTFLCLEELKRLGEETWFNIGDRDFGTHIYRTHLSTQGHRASEIALKISRTFGIKEHINIVPMTDTGVETWIVTDQGEMHFQEYLVKNHMKPSVIRVYIKNIDRAVPPPGVVNYIKEAQAVIICPSNPIISIGPILHVKGIRDALKSSEAKTIAISPLIGGASLKGPADRMMRGLGLEVSSTGVARLYRDFIDIMVIDEQDRDEAPKIEELGVDTLVVNTVMSDVGKASALARAVLSLL